MKNNKILMAYFAFVLAMLILVPYGSQLLNSPKKDEVVLSKDNTIIFAGEVNGELEGQVLSQAKKMDNKIFSNNAPIYLFMNTPGGSIQSGLEIIEGLSGLRRPIMTITMFSASMGFQIVQNLGDRLILKNGILMNHRANGEIKGYFGGQRPSQMDNRYNLWLSRLQELDEQTVRRTNGKQTLQSYQKSYADELWLTGSQAVAGGYADRIVTVRCDSSLDGVSSHELDFFGIEIQYDLDNCPLNTSPMNIRIKAPENNKMSAEQKKDIQVRFIEQYVSRQRAIIPTYW